MTSIAILCPTRGRPDQCRRMIQSAKNTSTSDPYVAIGFCSGDQSDYTQTTKFPDTFIPMTFPDGTPTVHKWNMLAQETIKYQPDVKLFMLGADDIVFETDGWDKAVIEHYEGLKEKAHVYHLRDSRNKEGLPHPIVTREYIEALGYAFPPIFLHWKIDTWTAAIAKANGIFTHMKDYLLVHDKPSDRGEPDETFSRIRRQGWRERDQYVEDTCGHFLQYEIKRLDDYLRRSEAV